MKKSLEGGYIDVSSPRDEEEDSRKLVTAMKIFKRGTPNISIIKTTIPLDFSAIPNMYRGIQHFRRVNGPMYVLSTSEVDEFRGLWLALRKTNLMKDEPLPLAIKHFTYAYERERIEEKMTDYLIAFEALFVKREPTREYTHKLATRVARLVGKTYEDRKQIALKMRNFYGIRSGIVHGQEVDVDDKLVFEAETLLRETIGRMLEKLEVQTYDDIISHLDLGEN